jgi:hypothetical protein
MAPKSDPKDDRIAELELSLEAANAATVEAQKQAQSIGALQASVSEKEETIRVRDAEIVTLKADIKALKSASQASNTASVKDLPKNAVQLARTCVVTNSLTNTPIYPVAGDVLAAVKDAAELAAIQSKIGSMHNVHPVSDSEIEAARRSGRAL